MRPVATCEPAKDHSSPLQQAYLDSTESRTQSFKELTAKDAASAKIIEQRMRKLIRLHEQIAQWRTKIATSRCAVYCPRSFYHFLQACRSASLLVEVRCWILVYRSDRLGSSAWQTTSFSRQEFFGCSVEMVEFAFLSAISMLRMKYDTNTFGGFTANIGDSRGLCDSPLPTSLLVPILVSL
jgi:hypothetical protein